MVKYSPLVEGIVIGEGLYLTVYPKSSHNADSIINLQLLNKHDAGNKSLSIFIVIEIFEGALTI